MMIILKPHVISCPSGDPALRICGPWAGRDIPQAFYLYYLEPISFIWWTGSCHHRGIYMSRDLSCPEPGRLASLKLLRVSASCSSLGALPFYIKVFSRFEFLCFFPALLMIIRAWLADMHTCCEGL